jgi:hypothetical protein
MRGVDDFGAEVDSIFGGLSGARRVAGERINDAYLDGLGGTHSRRGE